MIPTDAYGGTYRLVAKVHGPAGLAYDTAELTDLDAWRAVAAETRMVWVETPTNPLLAIVDIAAVAAFAARAGAAASSTTPSPRRTCSSRWPWAPTSWSTRRPSTWAATPTSSAASPA